MAEQPKEDLPLVAKVRLKEKDQNGQFGPFIITNDSHPSLKSIVKAFNNSNMVKLGYSTIQKDKGIVHPTMKRKNLYLTGSSCRDHLSNMTFANYELVTDASPDEIKMILSLPFTKIKEVKPQTNDLEILSKYRKLPERFGDENCFYASRWDSHGTEIEITAVINGQKAHIATFNRNTKNRMISPDEALFSTSMEEDATTRDITINALYIKLKNDDGENGELSDPQGGMHDLKAGVIHLIRKPETTFAKNPYLPFILCNVAARFANDGNVPENICHYIRNMEKAQYDPQILRRLLVSALENHDVNFSKYVENLVACDLFGKILPKMKYHNVCQMVRCDMIPKNKIIAIAIMLLNNDPFEADNILRTQGYSNIDVDNIIFLLKLGRLVKNDVKNPHFVHDLFDKPNHITKNKIKEFLALLGKPDAYKDVIDNKFNYYKNNEI